MITDDTILERLRWQGFDNNKSYYVAAHKYNEILSYVFPGLDIAATRIYSDGIEIEAWRKENRYFQGIKLSFWDGIAGRTCFRCIEFKGTAKDYKVKVLEKFEVLKSLKQIADTQTIIRKNRENVAEFEITKLAEIAKRAFDKYEVKISKSMAGYRLTLEIDFNDKRELLSLCDKEE